jgi:hypothetical protein
MGKGWISLGSLSKTCTRKAPQGARYGAYLWPPQGGGMESGTEGHCAERDAFLHLTEDQSIGTSGYLVSV